MNDVDILECAYEKLKDKYNIVLTSTKAIDERYTIDTMAITGKNKYGKFDLYSDGFLYVFSVEYNDNTSLHFHPWDLEDIIKYIEQFMIEGNISI